jgi:hypothetical protein
MPDTVKRLIGSYKLQMAIMSSKTLSDEEKQKSLLKQIPIQLLNLLKLIWGIFLFISPFLLLILLDEYLIELNAEVLYRVEGILISVLAVLVYIALKKKYGPVFKSGKKPS